MQSVAVPLILAPLTVTVCPLLCMPELGQGEVVADERHRGKGRQGRAVRMSATLAAGQASMMKMMTIMARRKRTWAFQALMMRVAPALGHKHKGRRTGQGQGQAGDKEGMGPAAAGHRTAVEAACMPVPVLTAVMRAGLPTARVALPLCMVCRLSKSTPVGVPQWHHRQYPVQGQAIG